MKRILTAVLMFLAAGASAQTIATCPAGGPLTYMPTSILFKAPGANYASPYRVGQLSHTWEMEERMGKFTYTSGVFINSQGKIQLINPNVPAQTPMAFYIEIEASKREASQPPYFDGADPVTWSTDTPYPVFFQSGPNKIAMGSANAREYAKGATYNWAWRFTFTPVSKSATRPVPEAGFGYVNVRGVSARRVPENTVSNYQIVPCEGTQASAGFWKDGEVTAPTPCIIATYGFTSPQLQEMSRGMFYSRPTKKDAGPVVETKGAYPDRPLTWSELMTGHVLHNRTPLTGESSIGNC